MKNISKRLLILRKERNLTQGDVSTGTHISINGYRKIERGESDPTLQTLEALADYFRVSIDYLVGRSEK